jgi:hypothetical protein
MARFRTVRSLSTIAALAGIFCPLSASADLFFTANLTAAQEAAPNLSTSTATGIATFSLNTAQTAFTYNATITGLDFTGNQTPAIATDNLTNAHIHAAAPPGTSAGVVFGFIGTPFNDVLAPTVVVTPFTDGVGGTVSGVWNATEGNNTTLTAQIPNILAGLSYINFHTTQFPSGAIRGQILPATSAPIPEPTTLSLFAGGLLFGARFLRRRRERDSA